VANAKTFAYIAREALCRFPIGREVPKAAAAVIRSQRCTRFPAPSEQCSCLGLAGRPIERLVGCRADTAR